MAYTKKCREKNNMEIAIYESMKCSIIFHVGINVKKKSLQQCFTFQTLFFFSFLLTKMNMQSCYIRFLPELKLNAQIFFFNYGNAECSFEFMEF